MSAETPKLSLDRPRRRWLWRSVQIAAVVLIIGLGGVISLTKPFQDGATGVFSKVVDGVKDHPGTTLAVCLGGVGLLWLGIGVLAAGQELRGRPRASPHDEAGPSRPA